MELRTICYLMADQEEDFKTLFEQLSERFNIAAESPQFDNNQKSLLFNEIATTLMGANLSEAALASSVVDEKNNLIQSAILLLQSISKFQAKQGTILHSNGQPTFGEEIAFGLALKDVKNIEFYNNLIANHYVLNEEHILEIIKKHGIIEEVLKLLGTSIAKEGTHKATLVNSFSKEIHNSQPLFFEHGEFFKALCKQCLCTAGLEDKAALEPRDLNPENLTNCLSYFFTNKEVVKRLARKGQQFIISKLKKTQNHNITWSVYSQPSEYEGYLPSVEWRFELLSLESIPDIFEAMIDSLEDVKNTIGVNPQAVGYTSIEKTIFLIEQSYVSENQLGLIVSKSSDLHDITRKLVSVLIELKKEYSFNVIHLELPLGLYLTYWLARINKDDLEYYITLINQYQILNFDPVEDQITDLAERHNIDKSIFDRT
jgi:hypothetical protein